jgi:hypothetical protein
MVPAPTMVTVVIPTLASRDRADQLVRAVASVRASSRSPVHIAAVVNGDRSDERVLEWIGQQPDVQCVRLERGSAPLARLCGRELVRTEFFSFLDDDDEYLPDATDLKLDVLRRRPRAALVVANGFYQQAGTQRTMYDLMMDVTADPLVALFRENWLNDCNALFRSSAVPVDYFQQTHDYCEWTWIAYRLALDAKEVAILDAPAFRCHDSPASLSKSAAYRSALIPLFERMLALSPPRPVARLIRRRIASAHHAFSSDALARGDRLAAWRAHLSSLATPGGWRYLAYSRHLLFGRRSISHP